MDKGDAIKATVGLAVGLGVYSLAPSHEVFADDPQPPADQNPNQQQQNEQSTDSQPSYTTTGGETLQGIANRYGVDPNALATANPNVDFGNGLPAGTVISVPEAQKKEVKTEKTSFSSGIIVVTTVDESAQQPEKSAPKIDEITGQESASQLSSTTEAVSSDNKTAPAGINTAEPTFINMPFAESKKPDILKTSVAQQAAGSNIAATAPQAEQFSTRIATPETATQQNAPITVTVDSPAEITFDGTSIHVSLRELNDNSQETNQSSSGQSTEKPQNQSTRYTSMPNTQPSATVSPEAKTQSGNYREYLSTFTQTPEPTKVTELKEVSVYSGDGLLRRSKAYPDKMQWLEENTTSRISVEGYKLFEQNGIDTSLASKNIFGPELPNNGNKKIEDVQCYTMHWTAGIVKDPERAATIMLNRDVTANVQLMTMQDGIPYQFTQTLDTKAYHAGKANNRCIGNEIVGNDLLDFTPEQTASNIYLTVLAHRLYGMPLVRDLAAIEAQPLNQYGDFTPIKNAEMVGPIGHVEVPDTHKLDPTVMYVNYVYEQALALNALLESGGYSSPASPPSSIEQSPQNESVTEVDPKSSLQLNPEPELGSLSISQLVEAPVLTADQYQLNLRSQEASTIDPDGSGVKDEQASTSKTEESQQAVVPPATEESQQKPDVIENPNSETEAKLLALLSDTAKNYVPETNPRRAYEKATHSVQNGGNLSYEEAYGPQLEPRDMYIYLRLEGASHEEAVTFTAISTRETGRRAAAVGDVDPEDNGVIMPSFGPLQIRDLLDGNPLRNPIENLNPRLAAKNGIAMYRVSGGKPWESEVPSVATVESVFEATRLKNRKMSPQKRAEFDARLHKDIQYVFSDIEEVREQVEVILKASL